MSEELKRRLYDYEADPPETLWSRITGALDGEIYAEFPQKLYEAEATPPTDTWNKIKAALETDAVEEYPVKLYNLEIIPPDDTWKKISVALDEEKALPRIPSKRKIAPFVKYAAAACIVGVATFGVFRLLNQKSTDHPVAILTPRNTSPAVTQPESQKNSLPQTIPSVTNNLPKEKTILTKTTIGSRRKFAIQQPGYTVQIVNPSSAISSASALNFQQASLSGGIPGSHSLVSDADRYLMFMNPDGYLIRISKKLAEALGCFYTRGDSEEYKQCQEQIKKWRDKIAQSQAASSPDNFMDILDIIKSIQDNEF